MAEQSVTLNPGESRLIAFEAIPAEARTYQVSVDGLTGSFIASEVPTKLYGYITDNETGEPVFGADITIYQDYDTKTADYHAFTNEQGYYEITDMIPEVRADMVIYAGGYKDYTRTGIPIHEGDNERNIVLTWAGGSRIVPRFISYSLPPQIVSGEEFPASVTVWLPYQYRRFGAVLRLKGEERLDIWWSVLPAEIYDVLRPSAQEDHFRFTEEGQYTLHKSVVADYWKKYRGWLPLPPGTYEVSYYVYRQKVDPSGGLLEYMETDYENWGIVGTVEIV